MSDKIEISIVVENRALHSALIPQHGWAAWIDTGPKKLLFDTGQGAEIAKNARVMDIDLKQCDAIVLSHGHYDHTGGLAYVLAGDKEMPIYAHPEALQKKFASNGDGTSRYNGMPESSRELFANRDVQLIETRLPTDVGFGLVVTGSIPRQSEFEDVGGPFYLDSRCSEPDPFTDDQALYFESTEGLVVLLGCAHAGVVNTLMYIQQVTGIKKIHAVLGGMHLIRASAHRLQKTIEFFRSLEPAILGLAHCTGDFAAESIYRAFTDKCMECWAGTRLSFAI